MAVAQTSRCIRSQPAAKYHADKFALELLCLGSFVLLGLITVGAL